jgi:DHA2 family multidrug resistance protein
MPSARVAKRRFDFFGFAMLSIGLGALQLLLDRGEQLDWFASWEIWIEAGLAVTGFWVFVIHLLTSPHSFLDPAMFRDRNFATGLVFIFVVGIVLLATTALLPPMLQHLYGYPVVTTGLILAPRGVGTMISMIAVGRLMGRVDPRIMITSGILLTAWSLWDMTAFSPGMGSWPFLTSGIIQGLGLGLVFVPLSTVSFSTLPARYRTDAASLFSLVRNVGSSIGISVCATLLARNTQISHAELGAQVTPFAPGLSPEVLSGEVEALMRLNQQVTEQAAFIAYLDDFLFMMWVTLAALPLILLLRYRKAPAAAPHAAIE